MSINNFVYDIPTKVYFGKEQLGNLAFELEKFGKKVLLTYGTGSIKKTGLYDKIMKALDGKGFEIFELANIEPNPRIQSVRDGVKLAKDNDIDVILAVGGGSVIDASKFIAAGRFVSHDPWDFFVKGAKIDKALPLVTILTLSATGSEMDRGGVISNLETNQKIGRGDNNLLPKVSFLDPTNTFTVSKFQTASGAADIISHIFEVYFNVNDDFYMLDTFMEGLIKTVIKYAPIAMEDGENYEARANLMWASSWAINGFVASGKRQAWSTHPMEHELSAFYDITHGLGLAILTPRWLKYSLNEKTIRKYVQLGINVFNIDENLDDIDIANRTIERISDFFFKDLKLTSNLEALGINEDNFELMAKKATNDDVIHGFIDLNKDDVVNIYKMSLKEE